MAIIYTYPDLGAVDGTEKLLVSDGSDENNTKTVTTAEYGAYISATYGGAGGLTIYQADGSITGNRTLSGAGNSLTFTGLSLFTVESSTTFSDLVTLDSTILIPDSASLGYVLTSDASGVAAWEAIPDSTILTINGTANRISVTGSGGPNTVVDIDSGYVGQTSIITLGTITTGTWNGTTISPIYGGTGQTGYSTGDIIYADGANSLDRLGIGNAGEVLTVSGGLPTWQSTSSSTLTNVTTTYTVLSTDETVNCSSASGFTVNLTTAVGVVGRKIIIKNSGAGDITVDANTTETIDGALTVTLVQYESITIQSDGANWIII